MQDLTELSRISNLGLSPCVVLSWMATHSLRIWVWPPVWIPFKGYSRSFPLALGSTHLIYGHAPSHSFSLLPICVPLIQRSLVRSLLGLSIYCLSHLLLHVNLYLACFSRAFLLLTNFTFCKSKFVWIKAIVKIIGGFFLRFILLFIFYFILFLVASGLSCITQDLCWGMRALSLQYASFSLVAACGFSLSSCGERGLQGMRAL